MIVDKDTQQLKNLFLTTEIMVESIASLFFGIYDIVFKTSIFCK